jgi:hypothetical protein
VPKKSGFDGSGMLGRNESRIRPAEMSSSTFDAIRNKRKGFKALIFKLSGGF